MDAIGSRKECEENQVDQYKIGRKIFVGNISYRVQSRQLSKFFSKFGRVEYCYIVKDHLKKWSKGIAFITFKTEESMRRALQASEEDLFLDSRQMRVKPAELSNKATYWQDSTQPDHEDGKSWTMDHTEAEASQESEDVKMDTNAAHEDNGESCTSMECLFDELLVRIFSLLSIRERIAIERVCWRWKLAVQKTWRRQRTLTFQNMFKNFEGMTDKMLNSVLSRCGQYLHTLDTSASPRLLTDFAMDIIGKYSPQLVELDLTGVKVTDISMANLVSKCSRLQKVRLKKCHYISNKGVSNLLKGSPHLQYLDLSELYSLSGQNCFDGVGAELQILNLSECYQMSDRGLMTVSSRCPRLQGLNLAKCRTLSSAAYNHLFQNSKSLRKLNLEAIRVSAATLNGLRELTNLEELNLSFGQYVNDETMNAIAEGCKKLRHLDISSCELTDTGVSYLARLPDLQSINMSYMYSQVSAQSVVCLAGAGHLRRFVARTSKCVTNESVIALASLCPSLEHLDLSGCFEITNDIFEGFRHTCPGDDQRTIDLYLGGTSVDWVSDDVNWMSGFAHLNVSMHNLAMYELQPERDIILPEFDSQDEEDSVPMVAVPDVVFHHDLNEGDGWEEDGDFGDEFLNNDDPLEDERWDLS